MSKLNHNIMEYVLWNQFHSAFTNHIAPVKDSRQWTHDMDFIVHNWFDPEHEVGKSYIPPEHTYSISCKQMYNYEKYGNVVFEKELENTRTGAVMEGSFTKCKADDYYIALGKEYWLIFSTQDLKDFIKEFKDVIPVKPLTKSSLNDNKKQKRAYDQAWNYCVPITMLVKNVKHKLLPVCKEAYKLSVEQYKKAYPDLPQYMLERL